MNAWYVTIKDIIGYNGFGFKGVSEHSLSVWLLIPLLFPPFSQVGIMTSTSRVTYVKMESILACKVSCVPNEVGFTCLAKSCNLFLEL